MFSVLIYKIIMYNKQIAILTNCLEQLDYYKNDSVEWSQNMVNTLRNYPKPYKKGEHLKSFENPILLGAYLYTSNVRNACKLIQLGHISSIAVIKENIIKALNILIN